jgi:hypothetical protein
MDCRRNLLSEKCKRFFGLVMIPICDSNEDSHSYFLFRTWLVSLRPIPALQVALNFALVLILALALTL